jgi:hypothetical protein
MPSSEARVFPPPRCSRRCTSGWPQTLPSLFSKHRPYRCCNPVASHSICPINGQRHTPFRQLPYTFHITSARTATAVLPETKSRPVARHGPPVPRRLVGDRDPTPYFITNLHRIMFSTFKRTIVRAPPLPPSVTTANPESPRLAPDIHLVSTAKTPSLPYSHMLAIVRVQPIPIERSNSSGLPLAAHTLQDIPRARSVSTLKSSPTSPLKTSSGQSNLTCLMAVYRLLSQGAFLPPPTKFSPKRSVTSMRSSGPS